MITEQTVMLPPREKRYFYEEYLELVKKHVENGTASGQEPTPDRVAATKINLQRMTRIAKQYKPSEKMAALLNTLKRPLRWIVIAESWCGDAAQNLPVIALIADSTENIELSVVLRDENPEFMDHFLTNGSRSIPKLVCFDPATDEVLFVWGARPTAIQEWTLQFKKDHPGISHDDFHKELHLLYAKDRGNALEADLFQLISPLLG